MPQNPSQILRFRVGHVLLGLDAGVVRRIVPFPHGLVRLDRARHHCGVFRDEGALVSVIDLRVVLGQEERRTEQPPVIITEVQGRHYGLLVDAVDRLVAARSGREASLPAPLPQDLFVRTWLFGQDLVLEPDAMRIVHARPLAPGWHVPFFPGQGAGAGRGGRAQPHKKATGTHEQAARSRAPQEKGRASASLPNKTDASPSDRKKAERREPARPEAESSTAHSVSRKKPVRERAAPPAHARIGTKQQAREGARVRTHPDSGMTSAQRRAGPGNEPEGGSSVHGNSTVPTGHSEFTPPQAEAEQVPASVEDRGGWIWPLLILSGLLLAVGLVGWAIWWVPAPETPAPVARDVGSPEWLLSAIPYRVHRPGRSLDAALMKAPEIPEAGSVQQDTQPVVQESETRIATGTGFDIRRQGRNVIMRVVEAGTQDTEDTGDSGQQPAMDRSAEAVEASESSERDVSRGSIQPAGETQAVVSTLQSNDTSGEESGAVNRVRGTAECARTFEVRRMTHVVVPGDTLWDIAQRYLGNPWRYPELARLSRIRDPDLIYPGDRVIMVVERRGKGKCR